MQHGVQMTTYAEVHATYFCDPLAGMMQWGAMGGCASAKSGVEANCATIYPAIFVADTPLQQKFDASMLLLEQITNFVTTCSLHPSRYTLLFLGTLGSRRSKCSMA